MMAVRATAVLVALAFLGATAVPAFAQTKPADVKSTEATKDDASATNTTDKDQSNKGGEVRGLDRADQAAGEHGKQGRDNARAKRGR